MPEKTARPAVYGAQRQRNMGSIPSTKIFVDTTNVFVVMSTS